MKLALGVQFGAFREKQKQVDLNVNRARLDQRYMELSRYLAPADVSCHCVTLRE